MLDNDELIRLVRTGVQAAVTGLVALVAAWLLDSAGVEIDQEATVLVLLPIVFGVVMPAVTWVVGKLEEIPVIGHRLVLLNGPRRQVEYSNPE